MEMELRRSRATATSQAEVLTFIRELLQSGIADDEKLSLIGSCVFIDNNDEEDNVG